MTPSLLVSQPRIPRVQVPGSNFQGSCAPSGLGRDLWIMDEQKGFVVVMCSKLVSNQLLRSPETERAEGRSAPFISPSPRSLGGCTVPTPLSQSC